MPAPTDDVMDQAQTQVSAGPGAAELTPEQQRQLLAVGRLFSVLAQDPKTRPKILSVVKEVYPQYPIPEVDVPQMVESKVEERLKGLDEALKPIREELAQLKGHLVRKRWAEEHGLSDEEVLDIEKLARDHKIGDAKAALELWQARQLGRPRTTNVLEGLAEEEKALLRRNPKEFALRVGRRVLADVRARQARSA
jgi:Skp family chaperone for outer membrane proteins